MFAHALAVEHSFLHTTAPLTVGVILAVLVVALCRRLMDR